MLAKRKLLGEFRVGKTLGEGAFSKVKLATHKTTNQKVAIKIIKKEDIEREKEKEKQNDPGAVTTAPTTTGTTDAFRLLTKEVRLLMRLDHPNVIKLYQVIETGGELYIIMEYATGGEMIEYIASKGSLPEKESRKYFRQLISALDHCHMAGVVHRDLKLENLLLSGEKNLLLSDFGLGRSYHTQNHYLNTFCGTPLYAAPELVSGISYIGPPADIWSMGVVLFIMASGKPPFQCQTIAELYKQIKSVRYTCPPDFSAGLKTLLTKVLVRDPTARATMEELRVDEWVNNGEDAPPPKILPRIMASTHDDITSVDEELNKIISVNTLKDGAKVYNFKKNNGFFIKFDEEEEIQPAEPVSPEGHRSRRRSLAEALGRFNPFSRDPGASTTSTASQPVPTPRQRAFSISGPAQGVAVGSSAPVSPLSPISPVLVVPTASSNASPTNAALQPVKRRHSFAVASNTVPTSPRPNNSISTAAESSRPSGNSPQTSGEKLTIQTSPTMLKPTARPGSADSGIASALPRRISATPRISMGMQQIDEDEVGPLPSPPSPSSTMPTSPTTLSLPQQPASRRESWTEPVPLATEIRTVRFSFSMKTTPMLSKSPNAIKQLVQDTLKKIQGASLEMEGAFTFIMTREGVQGRVVIEVEVCRVWLLKLYAIKMRRVAGDALLYKETYDRVIAQLGW